MKLNYLNHPYDESKSNQNIIICPDHGEFNQTLSDLYRLKTNCPVCSKLKKSDSQKNISPEKLQLKREKFLKTCMEKYGVANPFQSNEVKEQLNKTLIEKYGSVENSYIQRQNKKKETCLEKYGVEHPLQNEKIQQQIQQTCLNRYGVTSNIMRPEIHKKAIESSMTSKSKQKRAKTNLKKYGTVNVFSSEYGKNKIKETNLKKYGTTIPQQLEEIKQKQRLSMIENWKPISINKFTSKIELDCKEYLKSFYNGIIEKNRKILDGKEIDIFLPELNVGIEINGDYYHGLSKTNMDFSGKKPMVKLRNNKLCSLTDFQRLYTLKRKLAYEKGIRLITISEFDWINDNNNRIHNFLKDLILPKKRIRASDCKIQYIDRKQADSFLEINHINGTATSSTRIGLFFKDELIMVSTFAHDRFKSTGIECIRNATKLGVQVYGGLTKIKKFVKFEFRSFIDARYFQGKISGTNCGYRYIKQSPPEQHNRIEFQKHKMKKFCKNFDPNKSEFQNAIENNWIRIYDLGTVIA